MYRIQYVSRKMRKCGENPAVPSADKAPGAAEAAARKEIRES